MSLARIQPPILLVEDNTPLREMLSALLRRQGLEIETAECFEEAHSFLESASISGLITDEDLGDGKGTALAEFALARNPRARVGIVSGDAPELPASLEGRVTVLTKPFSGEELRNFLADFPRAERPA